MFNSVATIRDPEPWVIHLGMGLGDDRFESYVPGALDHPRVLEPRRKSAALVRFRESTRLLGLTGPFNARVWLNTMSEFPGHLEASIDADELPHLRAVLHRLVNVYGEAT